jgi:FAD/FMN-containing dehydrogenase
MAVSPKVTMSIRELEGLKCVQGVVAGQLRLYQAAFAPSVALLDRIVHALATEFGGSISAEHVIGTSKLKELEHDRSAAELDLMQDIKSALEPAGVRNPGKVVCALPTAAQA